MKTTLAALLIGVGACAGAQLPPTSGRFTSQQAVELPLRMTHGLITVPVMINGKGPFNLILDTGAPVLVLQDTSQISKLALTVAGQTRVGGAGDGERQLAPIVTGVAARLGPLEVSNVTGIVGVTGSAIPGVDGVIGGPLFRHSVVHIDWDAGVIRFHDPASPPEIAGDTIPLRVAQDGHVYVPGRIAVNGVGRNLELHLDTGARQAFALAPASLQKMKVKPRISIKTVTGFGSRGVAHGTVMRADTLRLGRTSLIGVPSSVPKNEPSDEGRVGIPVLRRFNLVIDYPGKRLILVPRANVADAFRWNTTGIVLRPAKPGSPREVAFVMAGSPAEQGGIVAGDTLVTVGTTDIASLDPEGLERELIQPAPGTALLIASRRNGVVVERRVTSRILLP